MKMRPVEYRDRERIHEIVRSVGNFTSQEIAVAMELVDAALQNSNDYLVYVQEEEREVIGYVCFGPTPLTAATYDLYWIAVDPRYQGKGYGSMLIKFVETEVQKRNGKLVIVETSSLPEYDRTRRAYERAGFHLVSRIPNFYKPGDDKLTYIKEL